MAGTKVNFLDENNWTWRTVGDVDMKDILADLFQDGLQLVDYERINAKPNESSVCRFVLNTQLRDLRLFFSSVSSYHGFITRQDHAE